MLYFIHMVIVGIMAVVGATLLGKIWSIPIERLLKSQTTSNPIKIFGSCWMTVITAVVLMIFGLLSISGFITLVLYAEFIHASAH